MTESSPGSIGPQVCVIKHFGGDKFGQLFPSFEIWFFEVHDYILKLQWNMNTVLNSGV